MGKANEPAVAYGYATVHKGATIIPFSTKVRNDAGQRPVYEWNAGKKIALIEQGFTKNQLEGLKEKTSLDYDALARILGVTKATLHNKKGQDRLSVQVSEKMMLLADLYSFGHEMWGDAGSFNRWMQHPAFALGGITPVSYVDTVYGMETVRNIIGRIAQGILT